MAIHLSSLDMATGNQLRPRVQRIHGETNRTGPADMVNWQMLVWFVFHLKKHRKRFLKCKILRCRLECSNILSSENTCEEDINHCLEVIDIWMILFMFEVSLLALKKRIFKDFVKLQIIKTVSIRYQFRSNTDERLGEHGRTFSTGG